MLAVNYLVPRASSITLYTSVPDGNQQQWTFDFGAVIPQTWNWSATFGFRLYVIVHLSTTQLKSSSTLLPSVLGRAKLSNKSCLGAIVMSNK
jgi:hypothetical protein